MYLILPTKYGSVEDSRFKLFLTTIKNALNHQYITKVIVVDSSHERVYQHLKILLNNKRIVLLNQKDKKCLKGGSIREGIKYVTDNYGISVIAFQEPEKCNMIFHYIDILESYKGKNFICVPQRTLSSFDSYPKEQQNSERFMNMYISKLTNTELDWSFGPIIFTSDFAKYWLEFDGKLWDAQIIPICKAIQDDKKILIHKVTFRYPEVQKKEEEDSLEFIEKRRYQLNYMIDAVKKYLRS